MEMSTFQDAKEQLVEESTSSNQPGSNTIKKYAKDFTFGKVLGEGAYGAVSATLSLETLIIDF
jgi:hypothetical protein